MKSASPNSPIADLPEPKNLGLVFAGTAARLPSKKAFLYKHGGRYVSLTWSEASAKVRALASALVRHGLGPGDRIAVLSENRPEWAFVDFAAQMLGAVLVPIYPTLSSEEIRYILADSGAVMIAVSGKSLLEKVVPVQRALPALKGVLAFEASCSVSGEGLQIPLWFMRDFEKEPADPGLDARAAAVSADALASIIYTSGTTGPPKGVLLTHRNFIRNAALCRTALKMDESDVHLSFLPLSHVFERLAGQYLMTYIGATIAYAESMDTVSRDLLDVRPTFIMGVPRFYEKIRDRVLESLKKSSAVKTGLFFWALESGKRRRLAAEEGRSPGFFSDLQNSLAGALVYKKFRARLGGRVRFCVSGGAPLSKELGEFFHDLGVLIIEGYGLTETSPVISANRTDRYRFGTVGIPLEGIETRIAEDGEIVTRGDCVMKGYFNKPEETQTALEGGWFHTGDLGKIDKDGFLSITGRKKDLLVTSGGKKVATRLIEELVERDPYVLRCVLFGEGRKFVTALIVPRQEAIVEYARTEKIANTGYGKLLAEPKIHAFLESRIAALSKDLANYERIKYFALIESDFTQAAGELTPTLKVKRDVVLSRYKDLLLPFYEKEKGEIS